MKASRPCRQMQGLDAVPFQVWREEAGEAAARVRTLLARVGELPRQLFGRQQLGSYCAFILSRRLPPGPSPVASERRG